MRRATLLAGFLLAGAPLEAQQPAPPSCSAPEHRQFDFWIGDWEVRDSTGQRLLGTNRIDRELNDCVLHEQWAGARGMNPGRSYNAYDRRRSLWHQTWVDASGNVLLLDGGLQGGAMVLQNVSGPGGANIQRITWTPLPDGRVRQHWQASTDGGQTWSTQFDGYYSRQRG